MAGGKNLFEQLDRFSRDLFGDAAVERTQTTMRELYDGTVGNIPGLEGLRTKGSETLSDLTAQFNSAIPFIERAGYRVIEIEVMMGITPALIPRLMFVEPIPLEERQQLLEETRGKRLTNTLLASLFRATDWAEKGRFSDFRFFEIAIEVGLLPNVHLKFLREGEFARYGLARDFSGTVPAGIDEKGGKTGGDMPPAAEDTTDPKDP